MAKKAAVETPQPLTRRICFYCGGKEAEKCVHCFGTGITSNDLTEKEIADGRKRFEKLVEPPAAE